MLGSLIVAAAGLGTRMGGQGPKALQEVAGKPMMQWIVDAFRPYISDMIVICRPGQERLFDVVLSECGDVAARLVVQPAPLGTVDAVRRGLAEATSDVVTVAWADHLGASLFPGQWVSRGNQCDHPGMVLPLVEVSDPYVYFTPDAAGRRIVFNETRAGAPRVASGYSDCGVFLLRRDVVARAMDELMKAPSFGPTSTELNLLSLFSQFPGVGVDVSITILDDPRLALGVNTPEELRAAVAVLGLEGRA